MRDGKSGMSFSPDLKDPNNPNENKFALNLINFNNGIQIKNENSSARGKQNIVSHMTSYISSQTPATTVMMEARQ